MTRVSWRTLLFLKNAQKGQKRSKTGQKCLFCPFQTISRKVIGRCQQYLVDISQMHHSSVISKKIYFYIKKALSLFRTRPNQMRFFSTAHHGDYWGVPHFLPTATRSDTKTSSMSLLISSFDNHTMQTKTATINEPFVIFATRGVCRSAIIRILHSNNRSHNH